MNIIREKIWQETYDHLGLVIRWWIPNEGEDASYFTALLIRMDNYVRSLHCYCTEASPESIAEFMCENFLISAIEVKHIRTGYGVVNYVNWP